MYEPYLCNSCHDLMQKAINFNYVAIMYAINIMRNYNLKKVDFYKFLILKISGRMSTYYQEKQRESIKSSKRIL